MKNIFPLLLLISLLLPLQALTGAAEEANSAGVATSKKKSTAKKSPGKKQPPEKKKKEKVVVTRKKRPAEVVPTPLLSPAPLTPEDDAILQKGIVSFHWKGCSGTSSYRIQVSDSTTFTTTAIDDATKSVSYDTRAELAPGTYYWRVLAIHAHKKDVIWSEVRSFTIGDPFTATAINFVGADVASTNTTSVSLSISASSKSSIAGYYVSESSAVPDEHAPRWVAVTPSKSYASTIPYTLSAGDGMKTVYVWFKDAAGHRSKAASNTTVLDTKPALKITDKPRHPSKSSVAVFSFLLSGVSTTFQCKLDAGSFSTCTSPRRYTELTEGRHTFTVRAVDAAGKETSPPASHKWVITLPLKNTTPSDFINNGGAYFTDKNPVTLSISASTKQKTKIAGYLASESSVPPNASDARWVAVSPVEVYSGNVAFMLSDGGGKKTVYVWFKDTENDVSAAQNDTIFLFNSKHLVYVFMLMQAVFILL